MKTKKILASLLASVVTVASVTTLASCKKNDNPKDDEPTIEPSENKEDKKIVQAAIDKLAVDAEATGDFTLTIKGNGNVAITWASSNTEVIAIDGSNATVKRPAIGQADVVVKLTATAVLNDEQMTKEFTVTVKALEDTSSKVSEIKALADKTDVHAHGVVSGFLYASGSTDPEYKAGFYLTDETGTIYVFGSAAAKDLEVGNELYLDAVKGSYNGVAQLATPTNVNVAQEAASISQEAVIKGKTVADIVELGDKSLGNVYELDIMIYQNQYGAYSIEDPNFSQSNIPFVDTNNVSVGEYFSGSASKDLTSYAALLRGNEKKILHVTYFVNSKNNSGVLRGNVLTASVVDDSKLVELAQKYIVATDEKYGFDTNVNLPTTLFGDDSKVTISWAVKEGTTATIVDGVLTLKPTVNEENVTLTATFTRGTITETKDITFKTKLASIDEFEETALGDVSNKEDGETIKVSGQVVAVANNSYIISDGTNSLFIYTKDTPDSTAWTIGDYVSLIGKKTLYEKNKYVYLTPSIQAIKQEHESITEPSMSVLDATKSSSILSQTIVKCEKVSIKGTVVVSGSYVNITLDGTSNQVSIGNMTDAIKTQYKNLNGKIVDIEGYVYSESSGKFIYILSTSVKEAELTSSEKVKSELNVLSYNASYSSNVDLILTGKTYVDVKFTYEITEGSSVATIVDNQIVITQGNEEVTVKIVVTGKYGEDDSTIDTKEITFVVPKKVSIEVGENLEFALDFKEQATEITAKTDIESAISDSSKGINATVDFKTSGVNGARVKICKKESYAGSLALYKKSKSSTAGGEVNYLLSSQGYIYKIKEVVIELSSAMDLSFYVGDSKITGTLVENTKSTYKFDLSQLDANAFKLFNESASQAYINSLKIVYSVSAA